MRRVVITGMGIISNIGNSLDEVSKSLQIGKSGIKFQESYKAHGLKSNVAGTIDDTIVESIPKRNQRFLGDGAKYGYLAMEETLKTSGLEESMISSDKTGIIIGAGGTSVNALCNAIELSQQKENSKIGPFWVPKTMNSGAVAALAVLHKIRGVNLSVSSACSTSTHAVGLAYNLIQTGTQDIIFAGGVEESNWKLSVLFDAMGALSSHFNDTPEKASRPYDQDRDGFVIAGGAGVLALEELEHAKKRNAHIYGEIIGFALNSDGYDMVLPSGEGAVRCMRMALQNIGHNTVDYINTHGTSTKQGDIIELQSIGTIFQNNNIPLISSTKSMTGHSLGATGAQELIYTLLMMRDEFIAPSINIEHMDEACKPFPIVTKPIQKKINIAVSNSFGFGGTNGTLLVSKNI